MKDTPRPGISETVAFVAQQRGFIIQQPPEGFKPLGTTQENHVSSFHSLQADTPSMDQARRTPAIQSSSATVAAELDRNRRMIGAEPGHVPGAEPTDTTTSNLVGGILERWMRTSGYTFSEDAKSLALGAGEAYPEMQLLERLGLNPTNATLIDSSFDTATRARLGSTHPGLQTVESGLFSFLDNPTAGGFSLVTAFSVETPLSHPDAMPMLTSRLPKIMTPGGIVAIFPSGKLDASSHWKQNGFEPLSSLTTFKGPASLLAYRLVPQK